VLGGDNRAIERLRAKVKCKQNAAALWAGHISLGETVSINIILTQQVRTRADTLSALGELYMTFH
jgi:hypothetical protein